MSKSTQRIAQVKCADLPEEGENCWSLRERWKEVVLGMLPVGVLNVGKLLPDGEVNPQMQIYYITIEIDMIEI